MPADRLDTFSRVLTRPVPRRQMFRLGLGALAGTAASGVLAPRAEARTCEEYCASGTPCPSDEPLCCCVASSETPGAIVVPLGGACYDPATTRCCPVKRPDGSQSVVYCDAETEYCGPGGSGEDNCICKVPCGANCCGLDEECRGGRCHLRCPPDWVSFDGGCCPPGSTPNGRGTCTCAAAQKCQGDTCCPFGYVCGDSKVVYYGDDLPGGFESRRVCVGPPGPDGRWDSKIGYPMFPKAGVGLNSAPASSPRLAHAATSGSPREAIAAVATQGAAALAAWATPRRDPVFRRRVRAPRTTITVSGLPAGAKAALETALRAEAKANANLLAAGRARGRTLAALARRRTRLAARHSRDSGVFAARAARLYAGLPAKRAAAARALRAAGVAEVTVTDQQVLEAQRRFARGLPAGLSSRLASLGLTRDERRRARTRLAVTAPSSCTGPVLIAPLENRTINGRYASLAKDLKRYAKKTRSKPLTSTRRRPQPVAR